jgi:autoinducer 2-degrading protein
MEHMIVGGLWEERKAPIRDRNCASSDWMGSMFVQLVHIRIKPGCMAQFLDVFRGNYEGTRAEPGNYRFDVLQDPADENHFVIYEMFEDEAAVDAHRRTEHYRRTTEGLKALMATGERQKEFFRLVMPDRAAALAGE